VVLDPQASGLLGLPASHVLDGAVFACDRSPVRDVYVAGQCVIAQGRHAQQEGIASQFVQAMEALHAS
jgi:formimidoylglutamate deiminase